MKKVLLLTAIVIAVVKASAGPITFTVSNQSVASVTTASTKFLSANSKRTYLLIQNNGSTNVIVKFGSAQTGSEGIVIPAGGNYEMFKPSIDAVYMKSASSTDSVQLLEGQ